MSAVSPSFLDDDSDGFSGEDSVREVQGFDFQKNRKQYLSPKEIRYEPGQLRKTIIEHSIYQAQETPMRKISRFASTRLTPLNSWKSKLRKCKALIRPLHNRYYPFCVMLYILLATLASCYFFGATPAVVKETVLEPVAVTVGDAMTGMRDKMGDAYVGVRDSVGDMYSGAKERLMEEIEKMSVTEEDGKRNETSEEKKIDEKEKEQRFKEILREEVSKMTREMAQLREYQETQMNYQFNQFKYQIDADIRSIKERLSETESAIDYLKQDVEKKMKSIPNRTEWTSIKSEINFVSLEEYKMHLEDTEKELREIRRLIPREETEEYENLASFTHGASIIDSATSRSLYSSIFNIFSVDRAPLFLLTERQLFPGDCMPLPATGGKVGIRLSVLGHISHIEYYHLYWSEAGGIPLSAPREIKIMGCADDEATVNCETIAECEYTVENTVVRREEAKRRRVFGIPIDCPVKDESKSAVIKSIIVEVLSNHGAEHTCLYLTRVLGKAA